MLLLRFKKSIYYLLFTKSIFFKSADDGYLLTTFIVSYKLDHQRKHFTVLFQKYHNCRLKISQGRSSYSYSSQCILVQMYFSIEETPICIKIYYLYSKNILLVIISTRNIELAKNLSGLF